MSGILDDFKDAFSKRNNGLIQLIWLNVAIYIFTLLLFVTFTLFFKGGNLYYTLLSYVSLSPEPTTLLFRPWTFLTYSFLHHINPIVHIFPNMLMLYWFGSILQEYIGSRRLVGLYIVGAIFGAVLAVLAFNFIPYYHQNIASTSIIGASGSVMAVVFAAATLAPDYSFFLFLLNCFIFILVLNRFCTHQIYCIPVVDYISGGVYWCQCRWRNCTFGWSYFRLHLY